MDLILLLNIKKTTVLSSVPIFTVPIEIDIRFQTIILIDIQIVHPIAFDITFTMTIYQMLVPTNIFRQRRTLYITVTTHQNIIRSIYNPCQTIDLQSANPLLLPLTRTSLLISALIGLNILGFLIPIINCLVLFAVMHLVVDPYKFGNIHVFVLILLWLVNH